MDEIDKAIEWARHHPWLAAAIGLWLLLSALGHWTPSEELAKRYPRLVAVILLGRDLGITVFRAGKPLAAILAPSLARDLVDQVYHPADKTEPPPTPRDATPPQEPPRS
jgi:hypothetical protein